MSTARSFSARLPKVVIVQQQQQIVAPIYVPRPSVAASAYSFSVRDLPHDSLSSSDRRYFDWLAVAAENLGLLIPEYFSHPVDMSLDTIGTLESLIIAALYKIPPDDMLRKQKIGTATFWEGALPLLSQMSPDLRTYVNPTPNSWPQGAQLKAKYMAVSQPQAEIVQRLQKLLVERALAERSIVLSTVPKYELVLAVQDSAALALLARLQLLHRFVVNSNSKHISSLVEQLKLGLQISGLLAQVMPGRQVRNDTVISDLVPYMQRYQFANTEQTFVPINYGYASYPAYYPAQQVDVQVNEPQVVSLPPGTHLPTS